MGGSLNMTSKKKTTSRDLFVFFEKEQLIDFLHTFVKNNKKIYHYFVEHPSQEEQRERIRSLWMITYTSFAINTLSFVFPLSIMQIYDHIIPQQAYETLSVLSFFVALTIVLDFLLKTKRQELCLWFEGKVELKMSEHLYKKIFHNFFSNSDRYGKGYLYQKGNLPLSIKDYLSSGICIMVMDLLFLIICLVVITFISGPLVLVPIAVLLAQMIKTLNIEKERSMEIKSRNLHGEKIFDFVFESIKKIRTIKFLGIESNIQRKFERLNKKNIHSSSCALKESLSKYFEGGIFLQINQILIVFFGIILCINQQMTLGAVIATVVLSGRCAQPFSRLFQIIEKYKDIMMFSEKFHLFETKKKEETKDFKDIKEKTITFEKIETEEGILLFNGHDNFRIEENSCLCFSSKDNHLNHKLSHILMNLNSKKTGTICLGENDFPPPGYKIAYLSSHINLLKGTILDNITRFDKKNEELANRVIGTLGIKNEIAKLPKGLLTEISGSNEARIPSSLRQMIGIAAALSERPHMIVFHEADALLDLKHGKRIRNILEKIRGQYTLVIFSSRPSIIQLSEKNIFVSEKKSC